MTLYQILLAIQYSCMALLFFMCAFIIKKWSKPAHGYLFFYAVCALVNEAGYLAIMQATNLREAVLAWKFCYLGRTWIAFALFVFVLYFTKAKCRVWLTDILAFFHAFVYILVLTMEHNNLYYKFYYFSYDGIFPNLVRAKGVVHYIFDAVIILYIAGGLFRMLRALLKEKSVKKKRQFNFVLSAVFMNSVFVALEIIRIIPGYDMNNIGFVFTMFFFYIAIFHYDILDTHELARDFIIENMSEGVVVTNESDAPVFFNKKAEAIFKSLGVPQEEAAPHIKELMAKGKNLFAEKRIYDLGQEFLKSGAKTAGNVYMLTDSTERWRYTEALKVEKKKSESLLLNILPKEIADELTMNPGKTIARAYPNATVLFTDIVGFTKISGSMTAQEVVEMLNKITSLFDERAKRDGVEKIKTIGDSYMAAAGLTADSDNGGAKKIVRFAQGLIEDIEFFNKDSPVKIQIRIGVNSGNLVAGVIGKSKFIYDIWGDTVNVASRMESSGLPMKIHLSQSAREQVKDAFDLGEPVEIEIKGKGPMKTYYL